MALPRTAAALALSLLAAATPAAANHEVVDATLRLAPAGPSRAPVTAPARMTAFGAVATLAEQDPAAIEAALALDRATRRSIIQQGLRNAGFDPGTPDGPFRPRTRAAIRRWQAARGAPASGYLNDAEAELLRASGSPRPAASGARPTAAPPVAESPPPPPPPVVDCSGWNTEEFFETATAAAVTACLTAGADVAARDDDRITPLHWAAWNNDSPAVIEALVAAGAEVVAPMGDSRTILHLAAQNNENPAVIEALLEAGADIEVQDDRGWTPMHYAARSNDSPAVVEALLAAGANLAARSSEGLLPIQYAAYGNENPAVLRALLAAGADREADGLTLLHLAAQNNENPAVIETLVSAGADPMARSLSGPSSGDTPLHRAVSNEDPAVAEALIEAGCRPRGAQRDGRHRPGLGRRIRCARVDGDLDRGRRQPGSAGRIRPHASAQSRKGRRPISVPSQRRCSDRGRRQHGRAGQTRLDAAARSRFGGREVGRSDGAAARGWRSAGPNRRRPHSSACGGQHRPCPH